MIDTLYEDAQIVNAPPCSQFGSFSLASDDENLVCLGKFIRTGVNATWKAKLIQTPDGLFEWVWVEDDES